MYETQPTSSKSERPYAFTVRLATDDDAERVVVMHLVAHREAYGHLLPEEAFATREARIPERVERQKTIFAEPESEFWIAEDGEGVIGFCHVGSPRDSPDCAPRDVELRGLYVLERVYGTGVAHELVSRALGDDPAYVWLLEDNPRAMAFYRKLGFELNGARQELPPEWHHLMEVQMQR